jgi:hypothetical protein
MHAVPAEAVYAVCARVLHFWVTLGCLEGPQLPFKLCLVKGHLVALRTSMPESIATIEEGTKLIETTCACYRLCIGELSDSR